MSSRKVLALGVALTLNVAAARAQETGEAVPAPVSVSAPTEHPSPEAPAAATEAKAEAAPAADAFVPLQQEASQPYPAEAGYAVATEPQQPLGDAMAQDTSPALGTPPPIPSTR